MEKFLGGLVVLIMVLLVLAWVFEPAWLLQHCMNLFDADDACREWIPTDH